jgi:hypothetical protein
MKSCLKKNYNKCDKCGNQHSENAEGVTYWKCDDCDKFFCDECEEPNIIYTTCDNNNCYFCDIGICWNRKLIGELCDECYHNYDSESDSNSEYDSDSELDSDSEDEDTKKIMYESLENILSEKNYDVIEKIHEIKFHKIKKFKKRFEKESNKCEICYTRDKVCEFVCNHKTCLECFCKTYCLEKNRDCPFCKNHIGNIIYMKDL